MFRADINFIGTASSAHKEAEVCTAVVYAGNARDLNTVAPEVKNFLSNHMKKIEEEKKNPKPKKIKTKFQIEDPVLSHEHWRYSFQPIHFHDLKESIF